MDGSMEGMWRAQRDAAARFTEAWPELLESTAGRAANPGAVPGVEEQLQALTGSAVDYAGVALQPLRDLADNQRAFADQMTQWAQLQRDLADNMALWAARQSEYTDAFDRLLAPFAPRS